MTVKIKYKVDTPGRDSYTIYYKYSISDADILDGEVVEDKRGMRYCSIDNKLEIINWRKYKRLVRKDPMRQFIKHSVEKIQTDENTFQYLKDSR